MFSALAGGVWIRTDGRISGDGVQPSGWMILLSSSFRGAVGGSLTALSWFSSSAVFLAVAGRVRITPEDNSPPFQPQQQGMCCISVLGHSGNMGAFFKLILSCVIVCNQSSLRMNIFFQNMFHVCWKTRAPGENQTWETMQTETILI